MDQNISKITVEREKIFPRDAPNYTGHLKMLPTKRQRYINEYLGNQFFKKSNKKLTLFYTSSFHQNQEDIQDKLSKVHGNDNQHCILEMLILMIVK